MKPAVLLAAVVLGGCSIPEPKVVPPPPAEPVVTVFNIADPSILELSGLAVSRRNPGIVWAHNDSGDTPRLFAIDPTGATVMTLHLQDAQAVDWEDLAIGRGIDARSTLFIGDIGDNLKLRPEIVIYRVHEPLVTPGESQLTAEELRLRLPGGARDAEALLRDPLSDRLYIVTKDYTGHAEVFSTNALAPAGSKLEMDRAGKVGWGTLKNPEQWAVTAGDISPDGTRIALLTGSVVAEWSRERSESVEQALSRAPDRVVPWAQPSGESLAYGLDASLLLSREGPKPPVGRLEPFALR
jgi:hypothetical protein